MAGQTWGLCMRTHHSLPVIPIPSLALRCHEDNVVVYPNRPQGAFAHDARTGPWRRALSGGTTIDCPRCSIDLVHLSRAVYFGVLGPSLLFDDGYPPCASAAAVPKVQTKRGFNAHPPCVDKPVHARNTHSSKARYVTAMPGLAMLAVAEHHIQTNRVGLQCVVRCCDERNAQSQT